MKIEGVIVNQEIEGGIPFPRVILVSLLCLSAAAVAAAVLHCLPRSHLMLPSS